jgi:hypothetical protein
MGSYIKMAKNKVTSMIAEMSKQYESSEVRISIVGYRDNCDGWRNRYEIMDFTHDNLKAKNFLSKLKPLGGGDDAEDVNGGF